MKPIVSPDRQKSFLDRRTFLALSSSILLSGCSSEESAAPQVADAPAFDASSLVETIKGILSEHEVPGFAGGLILNGKLAWSGGFGFADLDNQIAMTESTRINIGSVTKTITATVVFQLLEVGKLKLDDDVNLYLDFSVRNPRHPDLPITMRQLLTHRSSILDGPPYDKSYRCGDPTTELGSWLAEYFGSSDRSQYFHTWAPGTLEPPEQPRAYSNVAFGLIGHIIERVTGLSYAEACDQMVFAPLGMTASGFWIRDLVPPPAVTAHAVPYSVVGSDFDLSDAPVEELLLQDPAAMTSLRPGQYAAHCLYSFATPPDGLLRSNVLDLVRFLQVYIGRGLRDGVQLLKEETLGMALSHDHFGRPLCWDTTDALGGEEFWVHSGGDPGISTFIGFRAQQRSALVMLFNTSDPGKATGAIARALAGAMQP